MRGWIEYKISDLCEVGRGSSPRPILDERYFVDGNIPWIKIADATASGKYIYETKEHVNEFGATFSRYLEPNSLIIAASGVSLGQIKFLGVKGCIHDGWLYVSNYKIELIDKEYLYYFLIYYSDAFHNFSSGAAIQNINTEILRNTKISLPNLSIQCKIASILSAYDELIENNKQRIKLLEEMAEEIYKEWFVRMRFPGHETAKFVELEANEVHIRMDGAIPYGWNIKSFNEVAEFINGFAFKPSDWKETGLPIVKISELKNGITNNTPRNDGKDVPMKLHVKQGELLFSWSADLDAYIWNGGEALLNQHIFKVVPFDFISKEYLFFSLKNQMEVFTNMSNGATMHHIKRQELSRVFLYIPDNLVLISFTKIVKPLLDEVGILIQKNQLLQQTRDLLLPRLISGKLSIEHLVEEPIPKG